MINLLTKAAARLARWYTQAHPCDERIGGDADPYMLRWYLWKNKRGLRIYLHLFLRDDDDRALHDHPGDYATWILDGGYVEIVPVDGALSVAETTSYHRQAGDMLLRRAARPHRIRLLRDGEGRRVQAITFFVMGKRWRAWGFHCLQGWRLHSEYSAQTIAADGTVTSKVGRGCA